MQWRVLLGLLIGLRVLFGPLTILLSMEGGHPALIIACLVTAMLSDLFDGIIARRLGIATATLRIADSWADAWFFVCVGTAAWFVAPEVIRAYAVVLAIEVVLQIASYAYDLVRYGRITSLHAYSAKLWGVSLYIAAAGLLAFHSGSMIWLAFGLGIVSVVDATIIKLILPGWRHDVLSSFHAMRQRRRELEQA